MTKQTTYVHSLITVLVTTPFYSKEWCVAETALGNYARIHGEMEKDPHQRQPGDTDTTDDPAENVVYDLDGISVYGYEERLVEDEGDHFFISTIMLGASMAIKIPSADGDTIRVVSYEKH